MGWHTLEYNRPPQPKKCIIGKNPCNHFRVRDNISVKYQISPKESIYIGQDPNGLGFKEKVSTEFSIHSANSGNCDTLLLSIMPQLTKKYGESYLNNEILIDINLLSQQVEYWEFGNESILANEILKKIESHNPKCVLYNLDIDSLIFLNDNDSLIKIQDVSGELKPKVQQDPYYCTTCDYDS